MRGVLAGSGVRVGMIHIMYCIVSILCVICHPSNASMYIIYIYLTQLLFHPILYKYLFNIPSRVYKIQQYSLAHSLCYGIL